ncbi:MAG: YuiB family protein [Novibacillus thermophilus]|uniref:Uncharacterized protein n=1 Tax=Novibacillus thermophilus TaxID=1471761 RepID=A0A1U9KBV0_9BACL|nr:YuiB family protein [Novibacillus thermophilus]AQS57473.1 hypothetical protein B0W44_09055 [Novibacillus thermophilus]
MNIYQFIVSIPLFLVLAFGLGFIINMIVKTTWAPSYVYILLVAFFVYRSGGMNGLDAVILLTGLVGVILSGIVIRTLRKKGYRMF